MKQHIFTGTINTIDQEIANVLQVPGCPVQITDLEQAKEIQNQLESLINLRKANLEMAVNTIHGEKK